jgi:PIN domain nuclease of toxin-antitoxin system
MKLLLDTHVLLWWLDDPAVLTEKARKAITAGRNIVYVSAATVWEVTLKKSLGKLVVPEDIEDVLETNQLTPLPITVKHALNVQMLPSHHKDPFDRILIAQAICENLTFVTRDPVNLKYAVAHILA